MPDGWNFLSRPDFWFGTIICGLLVNILSNVITARFARWVALVGGWKGALDVGLWLYAGTIVLCGVGSAFTREGSGPLQDELNIYFTPALAGAVPFALVLMEKGIVPRLLAAFGATIVTGATLYLLNTVPFPMMLSSKLLLFVFLNVLIGVVAVFAWIGSAVLWLWRHDMGSR
jgi:hypothetical protein